METEVLAEGSLKGFLSGKHNSRCKRVHQLLAAVVGSLHFQRFIDTETELSTVDVRDLLADMSSEIPLSFSPTLQRLFEQYEKYRQDTLDGKHGPTAQFWIIYVYFMDLYHLMSRAFRTGDYQLYIHVIPEIISILFAFNHQNYARWLTRFHDNLLRMEDTHPGITEEFENGAISIRRTKKAYSRIPVDLTLEQTINKDAASPLTGKKPYFVTNKNILITCVYRYNSHYQQFFCAPTVGYESFPNSCDRILSS